MIYLVSVGSEDKLPLTISGKTVRGGGSYNDDSKYAHRNHTYNDMIGTAHMYINVTNNS